MHMARMMISLILLCLLGTAAWADEIATAHVSLTPMKESPLGAGTEHAGHLLRECTATFDFGPQDYAIKYAACVDAVHEGNAVPLEGYIGMPVPSNCNWYHGGFLAIIINGQDIGTAQLNSMTISEDGARAIVDMVWKHPVADVRVRFMALPGKDFLMCEIALDPWVPVTSLTLKLSCYPSYFTSWNKRDGARRVQTPATLTPQIQTVSLPASENWWALYYDETFDVAKGEGIGPCGLMFDPDEASAINLSVGDYAISTDLIYPPETRRLHLAFWDFNGVKNADAMLRMQEQTQVDLECMRNSDFIPSILRGVDGEAMQADVRAALASPAVYEQLGERVEVIEKWLETPFDEVLKDPEQLTIAQEEVALLVVASYRDFMWDLKLAELLADF